MTATTATEILGELTRRGVHLEVAGDRLRFRPRGAVTPDLVEALARHKWEIIAALTGGKITGFGKCPGPQRCGDCYPIPGGRFLHPPKISPAGTDWLKKWEPKNEMVQ